MAWIESHQGIERHWKTDKLATAMGWGADVAIDIAISKLHRLWWWCLDFAPDGCVSRHSADMYARAVGLSADMGDRFIMALYNAEYLDKTSAGHLVIHDWLEYAGRYLRDTKFKRHPEKYKEIQQLYSTVVSRQSADNQPTCPTKKAKTIDMSAVPYQPTNHTVPNQPKDSLSCKHDYESIIKDLNKKTGKNFKHQGKAVREHINARFSEGHTIEDFYRVHDNMVAKWKNDPKMKSFLRPTTLYSPKFDSYLNMTVGLADRGVCSQKTERRLAALDAFVAEGKNDLT